MTWSGTFFSSLFEHCNQTYSHSFYRVSTAVRGSALSDQFQRVMSSRPLSKYGDGHSLGTLWIFLPRSKVRQKGALGLACQLL